MSVGVVIGARDGIVLAVDGKTSYGPRAGVAVVEDRRKFAVSGSGPTAVLLAGAAELAGQHTWRWAQRALNREHTGNDAPPTPQGIARHVQRNLVAAMEHDRVEREEQGRGANVAVDVVIGVVALNDRGTVHREVWSARVHPDWSSQPQMDEAFGPHGVKTTPMAVVPVGSAVLREVLQPLLANLSDSTVEAMRMRLDTVMPDLIEAHEARFRDERIGGTWTILELRPQTVPSPLSRRWGPYGP